MLIKRVAIITVLAFTLGQPSRVDGKAKAPPSPKQSIDRYSLTQGEPLKPKAKKAILPFVIYGDKAGQEVPFVPSGYMGDSASIKMSSTYESAPLPNGEQGASSLRVKYSAKGRNGWAGVYWLAPANNWGKIKGAGFDLTRAKRLTFWIRGEKGGEIINEIKLGGVTSGPYPDSGEASLGPLKLSTNWEQYTLDLSRVDAKHIIGGFAFIVRRIDAKKGMTFYLDEIVYEKDNTVISALDEFEAARKKRMEQKEELGESVPLPQPIRRIIPFDSAFTAFEPGSKNILDDIVDASFRHRDATVVVEGHTDSLGPADINMKLSRERANAVADYLVSRGLDRARLIVIGYGEERPLAPNSNKTEKDRKTNRRVEVVLIKDQ